MNGPMLLNKFKKQLPCLLQLQNGFHCVVCDNIFQNASQSEAVLNKVMVFLNGFKSRKDSKNRFTIWQFNEVTINNHQTLVK